MNHHFETAEFSISKVKTSSTAKLRASVITGFLGSGKTTLVSGILKQPQGERVAVIVNEFGEVGLDHQLVRHVAEDIVLLDTGCLCCALRNDLVETIEQLLERRDDMSIPSFDRILVETSGLAEPGPVVHSFMSEAEIVSKLCFDGVIATADAINFERQVETFSETANQLAFADRIVLTKTDIATAAQVNVVRNRLRSINPGAPIIVSTGAPIHMGELFGAGLYDPVTQVTNVSGWLREEAYATSHAHGHGIRSFCLNLTESIDLVSLTRWLSLLTALHGEEILRLKGIIAIIGEDRPLVIHAIHHLFHPPAFLEKWPYGMKEGRIVFITRNLSEADVRDSMSAYIK